MRFRLVSKTRRVGIPSIHSFVCEDFAHQRASRPRVSAISPRPFRERRRSRCRRAISRDAEPSLPSHPRANRAQVMCLSEGFESAQIEPLLAEDEEADFPMSDSQIMGVLSRFMADESLSITRDAKLSLSPSSTELFEVNWMDRGVYYSAVITCCYLRRSRKALTATAMQALMEDGDLGAAVWRYLRGTLSACVQRCQERLFGRGTLDDQELVFSVEYCDHSVEHCVPAHRIRLRRMRRCLFARGPDGGLLCV